MANTQDWTAFSGGCLADVVAAGCPCVAIGPDNLIVQCCSNNCILNCDTNTTLELKACGGVGPYTWEVLSGPGSVIPQFDTHFADVTHNGLTDRHGLPAYIKIELYDVQLTLPRTACSAASHLGGASGRTSVYDCNQIFLHYSSFPGNFPCAEGIGGTVFHTIWDYTKECGAGAGHNDTPVLGGGAGTWGIDSAPTTVQATANYPNCDGAPSGSVGPITVTTSPQAVLSDFIDLRTAEMKANNCFACDLTSIIVQVTDFNGLSIAIAV